MAAGGEWRGVGSLGSQACGCRRRVEEDRELRVTGLWLQEASGGGRVGSLGSADANYYTEHG